MGKIEVISALEQMQADSVIIDNVVEYLDESSEERVSFGVWAGWVEEAEEVRELLLGLWEQGYVLACKKAYQTVSESDTYIYTV